VDFSVYLPLYLGFALAAVTPRIARLLPPRTGVWALTAGAVTAATSWAVSLWLIAFTGLGRTSFVAAEGHWSANVWRRNDPVDVWTATAAGVVLCLCLVMFARSVARETVAWRHVRRLSRAFATDETLVFVDDDRPHAYAVGGRKPRIVISRGLLRSLAPGERRAVLSHETAHLRHHHHLHLLALRLSAAANPLLRPFVPAGVLAVERWADEETAITIGDRTLVARALLRAALAGAEHGRLPQGVLAHSTGDVSRRVKALMQEPPRPRWSVTAATSALLVATILAPAFAASNLDSLFDASSVVAAPVHAHRVGAGRGVDALDASLRRR
jgi:hypothetical protein